LGGGPRGHDLDRDPVAGREVDAAGGVEAAGAGGDRAADRGDGGGGGVATSLEHSEAWG
jgi:hypothetical protein